MRWNKISFYGNIKSKDVLLLIPLILAALYINLGLIALKGDEAIRSVVSLEMMISGNYITPTLTGELYFNKPPLYNWILAGFFKMFDNNSEFMVRFPTTLFLIIYCLTIWYYVKKELGRQAGILAAFVFLTCGRILFWDSFLGLIDIAFSWITFLNFMLIRQISGKRKYLQLFLFSYALTAIAFLLKGLPSLVFQGITILVIFLMNRNYRGLFSWKHAAGILVFLIITGSYYLVYYLQNPGYLDNALLRLITESTDKSAIGNGIQKTLIHTVTFPLQLVQHFLPWILLVVFLFHKRIFNRAMKQNFIRYSFLVLLANIIVYWLSPTTYPRYLLMLMPLAFVIFIYTGKFHAIHKTYHYRLIQYGFIIFMTGMALASFLLPLYYSSVLPVNHIAIKALIVLLMIAGAFVYVARSSAKPGLMYAFVLILLIARISFDLFLQPYRQSTDLLTTCRNDALELARGTKGSRLYYMTDTLTLHNVYYLTRERGEIVTRNNVPEPGSFFIVDDTLKAGPDFHRHFSMHVPYHYKIFYAGKFENR